MMPVAAVYSSITNACEHSLHVCRYCVSYERRSKQEKESFSEAHHAGGVLPTLTLANTHRAESPGHFGVGVFGKYAIPAFPSPGRMWSFHSSD